MKVKALQFGKAISAALFVLLLSVAGMKNALAQTQVATLQHGDDVSVYYGMNALGAAHDDAETGDIITLSSGSFAPITITKAVTLRGAGCVEDTVSGMHPTVISGNMVFNVSETEVSLSVEGIYFSNYAYRRTLHNPKFVRCNFNDFERQDDSMDNAQFVNCMFNHISFKNSSNTTLINCVVWGTEWMAQPEHTIIAFNSIFRLTDNAGGLTAYNCIFSRSGDYEHLTEYCIAYNCIGIGISFNPWFSCTNFNCVEYENYADVYETFEGDFTFEEPFILKNEIATGFLGNDGTEVGIHGGYVPYSNRPTYMVLKRCNVANRSTIDGKLSVDIEVVTEEE